MIAIRIVYVSPCEKASWGFSEILIDGVAVDSSWSAYDSCLNQRSFWVEIFFLGIARYFSLTFVIESIEFQLGCFRLGYRFWGFLVKGMPSVVVDLSFTCKNIRLGAA